MEDLSAAFDDMFDTLVTDLSEKISAQARIEAPRRSNFDVTWTKRFNV